MAEDDDRDDKTEAATPKRREDARQEGQVALSQEIVAASALAVGAGVLVLAGGNVASQAGLLLESSFTGLGSRGTREISIPEWSELVGASARSMALPVVLVILPLTVVILLAAYAQIGLQITPKAIGWKPSRIDPIQGWKRTFSTRGAVRTLSAFLKTIVITTVTAITAWNHVPAIAALSGADMGPMLAGVGSVLLHCATAALIAIVAVAAADLFYQRWQHERDLRMSRQDLREEARSTEGDPHVKARIRQVQREMARRRMMADVPKATVVITNPTHYAVALRYERDGEAQGKAPVVVAKGVDRIAQRIKEIAGESGVPLHEDIPLARALHAQVEIGASIPEALFQAVASVLAYVYRLQGTASR